MNRTKGSRVASHCLRGVGRLFGEVEDGYAPSVFVGTVPVWMVPIVLSISNISHATVQNKYVDNKTSYDE